MTRQLLIVNGLILCLVILFAAPYPLHAQSTPPQIKNLSIEIWPEFDRPEALLIYRLELSPVTTLPVELTFRLPGYLEEMHAIAVEQDGSLIDVNPDLIELNYEDDNLLLTFPSASTNLQFEYYDPVILTKQNQVRQLEFEFLAPYDIEAATLQVQEPLQAEQFSMTPAPDRTFTGLNGLTYNNKELAGLAAGETVSLSATYQRSSDALSVDSFPDNSGDLAGGLTGLDLDEAGGMITSIGENSWIGYLLVGAGVILLLGTGGYWWWSNSRSTSVAERRPVYRKTGRRPARRKKQATADRQSVKQPARPPVGESSGGYCYRCGTALRPDASFCHVCGAERRNT